LDFWREALGRMVAERGDGSFLAVLLFERRPARRDDFPGPKDF
jgi:hypothetical protein